MLFIKYYFYMLAVLAMPLSVCTQSLIKAEDEVKLQCLNALASSDKQSMEYSLAELTELSKSDSLAYAGALMMKMASVIEVPVEKLNSFKTGKKYLEQSIVKSPDNVEYRMLRALIQENAPGFLKYNQNIEEDVAMVKKNRTQLSAPLQAKVAKIKLFNQPEIVE